MRVAAIGLGSMGGGAARAMLARGLSVTGCDPSEAARAAFNAAGGQAVSRGCDIPAGTEGALVLTVNAAQARAAIFGADGCAQRMAPGGVLVVSATMAPADARSLAADARAGGLLYLDAPVSGGARAAAAGMMTMMASGSPQAFAAAQPMLDAVGGSVWKLGDAPGLGATMKVVHQLLAGVHIAVAAEAMALGIKAGLDPHQIYGVVTGAAGNSWMFQDRMAHVLSGDETPLSAVSIFIKDLGLVDALARDAGFPVPLAAQAMQMFIAAAANGHGGKDDAFVIRAYQALSGIALPGEAGGATTA